jgi:hypothetical protein
MATLFTLTEAQRRLHTILNATEGGIYTPEEAVKELADLKQDADKAGLKFQADYTLADFQKLRTDFLSEYQYDYDYDYEEGDEE